MPAMPVSPLTRCTTSSSMYNMATGHSDRPHETKITHFVVSPQMYRILDRLFPAEKRGRRVVKMSGIAYFIRQCIADGLATYYGIQLDEKYIHPRGRWYPPQRAVRLTQDEDQVDNTQTDSSAEAN